MKKTSPDNGNWIYLDKKDGWYLIVNKNNNKSAYQSILFYGW